MLNQEQKQSLGQLRFQKIPLPSKVLMTRKSSFVMKLSGIVLVFFIIMGLLNPDFRKVWPVIIFVELCIFAPLTVSLWGYERWKFKFFLYDHGIVVDAKGIEHIAKYEDLKITKWTTIDYRKWGKIVLSISMYTLQFPDGFKRTLHPIREEYSEYGKMFECAFDLSYKDIFPQAREKINAGESLEFGLFHLSRDGIQYDRNKFLWADGYHVEFKYYLGEFSTGIFKIVRENSGKATNQLHYLEVNHALVFIDLLKSMNKLVEENILNQS